MGWMGVLRERGGHNMGYVCDPSSGLTKPHQSTYTCTCITHRSFILRTQSAGLVSSGSSISAGGFTGGLMSVSRLCGAVRCVVWGILMSMCCLLYCWGWFDATQEDKTNNALPRWLWGNSMVGGGAMPCATRQNKQACTRTDGLTGWLTDLPLFSLFPSMRISKELSGRMTCLNDGGARALVSDCVCTGGDGAAPNASPITTTTPTTTPQRPFSFFINVTPHPTGFFLPPSLHPSTFNATRRTRV